MIKEDTRASIALACRMDSDRAMALTKKIFDYLFRNKKEKVSLETRIAPRILSHIGKDLNEMTGANTKFLISVGGDGTLLRILNSVSQSNPPPILGVNIGSIGFLDESNENSVFNDIDKVLNGEYYVQTHTKIAAFILKRDQSEIKLGNSINEVLIVSSKHSKVMQVSIKINGVFLNRSNLDGVMVSTSIGSTAYNLSAGGAIVDPELDIMQITPLNTFTRSGLKPFIVPIDTNVEIKLLRPRLNARIIIDGQQVIRKVLPNTVIRIRKSRAQAKFIRLLKDNPSKGYVVRLRKKILGYKSSISFNETSLEER